MATYVPPKRATEFIVYIGLESVATGAFQANPTLASGDVKVSKDGGALTNLTTLPTVTPAGGKLVKVTLSASEMDADNVTVVFSDASGTEWKELILVIQTAARQIDDLATPTNITAGTIASVTNGVTLADGAITAAKVATGAIDADALAADAVTEIQAGLATAAALATAAGYIDTEVAAIKAKTDNLPAAPAAVGDIPSAVAIAAAVIAADLESGKTLEQALLDLWAKDVGDAAANDASDPTLITYDSPDGSVQVTHVHTTTTRTKT